MTILKAMRRRLLFALGLAGVLQKLSQVKEAQLTFIEHRSSAFLVGEVKLTGSMTYRAPDFIVKLVKTPYSQRIEIDGDQLMIEKITDRGESSTQNYSLTASESLKTIVEGFRATLAGDLAILADSYDIELAGDMNAWKVVLTPRKEELLSQIEKIAVTGNNDQIKLIETFNTDGDESRLMLSYQAIK